MIATGGGAVVDPAQPLAAAARPRAGLARRPAGGACPAAAAEPERAAAHRRPRPDRCGPRPRCRPRALLRGGPPPERGGRGRLRDGRRRPARRRRSDAGHGAAARRHATRADHARRPARRAGARRGAARRRARRGRSCSRSPWRGRRSRRRSSRRSTGADCRCRSSCCPPARPPRRCRSSRPSTRELARLRVERREPIVAVGGGALGDAAGFAAAVYLRGVPVIHVPTTLVAQIDSSIGGKTAVDLPEGKNLVGAFHQPAAVIVDVSFLATLPERERRAALAEAVKMAALGDERLFALLESDGEAIATGAPSAFESGALAELVERAGVGEGRGRQRGRARAGRPDHAQPGPLARPRVRGRGRLRRAAPRRGRRVRASRRDPDRVAARRHAAGARPADRTRCSRRSASATTPLDLDPARVSEALATDKKHAAGHLQWVLPTEDGVTIRTDVPVRWSEETAAEVMRGTSRSRRRRRAPGEVPA